MELRPSEPEGLVAAEIGTVAIDGLDPARIQLKADILECDLFALH